MLPAEISNSDSGTPGTISVTTLGLERRIAHGCTTG